MSAAVRQGKLSGYSGNSRDRRRAVRKADAIVRRKLRNQILMLATIGDFRAAVAVASHRLDKKRVEAMKIEELQSLHAELMATYAWRSRSLPAMVEA